MPNIEFKCPSSPEILLTQMAVDKSGSMEKKERCLSLDTRLLFCLMQGGK